MQTRINSIFIKKVLLSTIAVGVASMAFASHVFTVCYHNQTKSSLDYINDGISHKWKTRGELVGSGEVAAKSSKCFTRIEDETMFSTDYITFTIGKDEGQTDYTRWVGIVNPAFSKPYLIAQAATATKGGVLTSTTKAAKNAHELHIFIQPDDTIIYSNSGNFSDTSQYIEPRFFK